MTAEPPRGGDISAVLAAGVGYRSWGWPVVLRGDQVRLNLGRDALALVLPAPLAARAVMLLTRRRCVPAMLAHPYVPARRVILAGERYAVPLPWPRHVQRVTGSLLLPPTVTPRGPITWVAEPEASSLVLCREIDVFAAVRTEQAE